MAGPYRGLIMARKQQRGPIPAGGPQSGAPSWPNLLPSVTLLQHQTGLCVHGGWRGSPRVPAAHSQAVPGEISSPGAHARVRVICFSAESLQRTSVTHGAPLALCSAGGCSPLIAPRPLLLTFSLLLLFFTQGMFVCGCERVSCLFCGRHHAAHTKMSCSRVRALLGDSF